MGRMPHARAMCFLPMVLTNAPGRKYVNAAIKTPVNISYQARYDCSADLEFMRSCGRYRDGRFSSDDVERSAHEIIDEGPGRLHERLKPYAEIDARLYAHAKERFEVIKEQIDLRLEPLTLRETGELTLYERPQSFCRISSQERKARLTRRLSVLKNYTREILGAVA